MMFAAAVAGLAVYMISVGLREASLIAEIAGSFAALAGLALALAARHSPSPREGERDELKMSHVSGGDVVQQADASPGKSLSLRMAHVTARNGIYQGKSVARVHTRGERRKGDRDV